MAVYPDYSSGTPTISGDAAQSRTFWDSVGGFLQLPRTLLDYIPLRPYREAKSEEPWIADYRQQMLLEDEPIELRKHQNKEIAGPAQQGFWDSSDMGRVPGERADGSTPWLLLALAAGGAVVLLATKGKKGKGKKGGTA